MNSDEHGLLRLPEVLELCGMSRSSLYRMIAGGKFPAPVKISERAVGWRKKDILDWLDDRPPA